MKNILILVRGYYPELSASGNLMKPLIEELGKKNRIYILSCADKNTKGNFTDHISFQKIKIKKPSSDIINKLMRHLKRKFIISYHNKKIVNSFKKEIVALDQENNFDMILAVTYEEILALLDINIPQNKKAVFLLEKLPISSNIPFIKQAKKRYKEKIENKILKNTSKVYALPIMYNYLNQSKKTGKQKLIQLEHPMITNHISPSKKYLNKIVLIYAGGLDKNQRNPRKMIDLFKSVNEELNIELVIYSYGNTQKELKKLARHNDFLFVNDTINQNQLEKEINNSNFLITIGNKQEDIVPSKIFDCISTGKAIIHFSQIEKDPYSNYLYRYPNSLTLKYNSNFTEDDINAITNFLKSNKNTTTSYKEIEKNFVECTPSYVAKIITSQIK